MLGKLKLASVSGAAAASVGIVALAASAGSADPTPPPNATELASKSVVVSRANAETGANLRLDVNRARLVDLSRAPSGLADAVFVLIPSKTGPCLLRTDRREVAPGLVEEDSLGCGTALAPTVAAGPAGTVGAIDGPGSVEVTLSDGSKVPADVDADGIWFAPPGASAASVTTSGRVERVDLGIVPQ